MIGCVVAREAALRGLTTVVVEKGTPGEEATSAAAGMLTLLGEAHHPGPFLRLARESMKLYEGFVQELREQGGVDPHLRIRGKLLLALSEKEEQELAEQLSWQQREGFVVSWHGGDEARRLEPSLSTEVRAALSSEGDAVIDSRLLGRCAWRAAQAAGVRFLLGEEAAAVRAGHGTARGIELSDGRVLSAPTVVVAAGAWSGQLRGLPRPLPVRPVKGQLLALAAQAPASGRILGSSGVYLVPQEGSGSRRMIVGATVEEAGFDKETRDGPLERLRAAAVSLLPALSEAPVLERWAGLRPGTPDELPILGRDPDVEGLLYATGHFRNGILLTPVTAALAGALLDGNTPELLGALGPDRFEAR